MPRDIETVFGPLSAQTFWHLFPLPVVRIVEWPWASPLQAILRTCGWTIHDVISDRRTAQELRTVWRLWKSSERLVDERERLNAASEILWWREMGCPVPCPSCGVIEPCGCDQATIARELDL